MDEMTDSDRATAAPVCCGYCGKKIPQEDRRGPKSRYCDATCRSRNQNRKNGDRARAARRRQAICPTCTQLFSTSNDLKIYCSDECQRRRSSTEVHVCGWCNEPFQPKGPRHAQFCCREHAFEQQRVDMASARAARAPALAKAREERRLAEAAKREAERAARVVVLHNLTCVECSRPFQHRNQATIYCSPNCRSHRTSRLKHEATVQPSICKECNETFIRGYADNRRHFCSDECKKSHLRWEKKLRGNHRRRARHYGVPYEPVDVYEVFDRDGWRCHMCGVKTPRKLRGTLDPTAPELDHVLPMSIGGAHSYANTACSCRRCNVRKGNKPIGQPRFDFGNPISLAA